MHHGLLQDPVFDDLKGSKRFTTALVWAQILTLCTFGKSNTCEFYQKMFCKDWRISQSTCSQALRYLMANNLIKCLQPYQSKGNRPGVYGLKGASIRYAKTLYQKERKPVSPRDTVINITNINRDDDIKISPPIKKEEVPSSMDDKETWE